MGDETCGKCQTDKTKNQASPLPPWNCRFARNCVFSPHTPHTALCFTNPCGVQRRYQKSTGTVIPKLAMARLVREVAQNYKSDVRFSSAYTYLAAIERLFNCLLS